MATRDRAALLTETSRVEAFSDGVLAIAITLLVLDLHTDYARGDFGHELLHQFPTYLAYVASFINIGVIWVNHHALFSRINRVDPALLWFNLYLLATASVLPFPTGVLASAFRTGSHGDRVAAAALYALVSVLMASAWLGLYRHLSRHADLLVEPGEQHMFRAMQRRAVIGISCYASVALLAVVFPAGAAVLILALPLFYALTSHGIARDSTRDLPEITQA